MIDVRHGDCRDVLATLPDESVHCVVTSPPYWGLRDYGVVGQLGLETTPDEHVVAMVGVFREVRRVLRADGTLWLNYGDCYAGSPNGRSAADVKALGNDDRTFRDKPFGTAVGGLKPKDLVGMPWRIAFALQADGWWLRSDIIWHKPNPMPESVTDRPTSAHEHVFLLSKSARYFYDAEAVREPGATPTTAEEYEARRMRGSWQEDKGDGIARYKRNDANMTPPGGRNLRNVWSIATAPFSEAHFATFPPALVEPCIKAGTSERGCCPACGAPWVRQTTAAYVKSPVHGAGSVVGRHEETGANGYDGAGMPRLNKEVTTIGWSPSCECSGNTAPLPCTVLDPFGGAGTVGLVADRLQRNAVLIELNPEYAEMARVRLQRDAGLFAQVVSA